MLAVLPIGIARTGCGLHNNGKPGMFGSDNSLSSFAEMFTGNHPCFSTVKPRYNDAIGHRDIIALTRISLQPIDY